MKYCEGSTIYDIRKCMRLYAVTDRGWTSVNQTLFEQVEQALRGGVTCVQVREKSLDKEEFLREVLELKDLCHSYNVPLIVNDAIDIAVRADADGVHVGQSDMSPESVRSIIGYDHILGVSAQTCAQAIEAQMCGADYIGVGAMFATPTKPDAEVVPMSVLHDICHAVNIPVVAIGGINKENISSLAGSGVDGIAVVSAVFAAPDITRACKELDAEVALI